MIKVFVSLTMIFITSMMLFINHPLSMGIMILIQTLLMCLITGLMINTYWYSYILFLTFSGGLLVLFMYISSVASNELFKVTIVNKMFMMLYFLFIICISLFLMNNLYWINMMVNEEMMTFFNMFSKMNYNNMNLTKLYNEQTYLLMMMMINYLFIALIAIVKITNIFFGPLRSTI